LACLFDISKSKDQLGYGAGAANPRNEVVAVWFLFSVKKDARWLVASCVTIIGGGQERSTSREKNRQTPSVRATPSDRDSYVHISIVLIYIWFVRSVTQSGHHIVYVHAP
jgi:hypothetical protein